jgi:hypothetical protein
VTGENIPKILPPSFVTGKSLENIPKIGKSITITTTPTKIKIHTVSSSDKPIVLLKAVSNASTSTSTSPLHSDTPINQARYSVVSNPTTRRVVKPVSFPLYENKE